jgi:hypothetical protein
MMGSLNFDMLAVYPFSPTEDKIDDKDIFHEELERAFDKFPK